MSRKIFRTQIVLLDWDGTLLNSYAADVRAYLAMFRTLGIDWGVAELERAYCPDWYQIYRAAQIPRASWQRANRLWRLAYSKERPRLLAGARAVIRTLGRHFTLGIVTSGSCGRVRKQLRGLQLRDYFATCVYSEDTSRRKPDPAPLALALRRLRANPDDAIYVGDTPEDIKMARGAGMRSIGVLGLFPTSKLIRAAGPDLLLRSIRDLPRHLKT